MPLKSLRGWLGVDRPKQDEFAPLRETLDALDHLELERARYLGAFGYLVGRVAHADQHVWASPDRIGTASMTLIFAFLGIEVALAPSGEVRDPARTVPRAIFSALALTTASLPSQAAAR